MYPSLQFNLLIICNNSCSLKEFKVLVFDCIIFVSSNSAGHVYDACIHFSK